MEPKMDARTRFKLGLVLLNLGVLTTAWFTWCAETSYHYSGSSGWEFFWNGVAAKHDLGRFTLTAMASAFVSTGIFFCVDALVWNRERAAHVAGSERA